MVFSSFVFLGIFLPAVLVLYFIIPARGWRNFVLLVFSLLFYAWGEPVWITAMIGITLLDYLSGLLLVKLKRKGIRAAVLGITVTLSLGLLFLFKYYNFFAENFAVLTGIGLPEFGYAMPIGISFFTFQSMSYVIDVYRGDVKVQKNYFYVLLYVSMFPQLIAGPIVRYSDIALQISNRRETVTGFCDGVSRFAIGLAKKVILANYAGEVAASLLGGNLSALSASGAWAGMALYSLQLYFDFSGYSDMAIGLGKVFGFDFKENFNYPYIARTGTEFWRRWHISLGTFFRDYVYIPLGGNRKRQYFNILAVWALTGIWHGASWNFLLWGLYYAFILTVEKLLKGKGVDMGKIPVLSNVYLLLVAIFGWGLFYYTDMGQLGQFMTSIFGLNETAVDLSLREMTSVYRYFWLIPVMVLAATPLPARIANKLFGKGRIFNFAQMVWSVALIGSSVLMLMNQSYNPFLYFRF